MTEKEFDSLPMEKINHVAYRHCYIQFYKNYTYDMCYFDITKRNPDGFRCGNTRRNYRFKEKDYTTKEKFLKAIKEVKFKGI